MDESSPFGMDAGTALILFTNESMFNNVHQCSEMFNNVNGIRIVEH